MPANTLEVKSHLILAKQFLAAGLMAVADGHNNAGATLAVNAVIHVKDAICLFEFGQNHRTLSHEQAGKQLASIPKIGGKLNATYSRVIAIKNQVEYSGALVSESTATQALNRTQGLVELVSLHILSRM